MKQEIWSAARFVTEWQGEIWGGETVTYKLFSVPRNVIDHREKGAAPLLIGIDSAGIRRVDVLMDTAYNRVIDPSDREDLVVALQSAPEEVISEIKEFAGELPEPWWE